MTFTVRTWSVWRVDRKRGERYLGTVQARHQPEAILMAMHRWAHLLDEQQVQGGFTVTVHT